MAQSPTSSETGFESSAQLSVGDQRYRIHRVDAVPGHDRLPYSLKILLENLLRAHDGTNVTAGHISALGSWQPQAAPSTEIAFTPSRVILQDFTGVPCVVDLATMREAMVALGGDPTTINPLAPVELVIDHSVIADVFGRPDAFERNVELEYQRNGERYQFLRWGQTAFDQFTVVPPGTGIVHQVNIEHLARVVMTRGGGDGGDPIAYPDTVVGTDSHTTMVNGLGVLGWGVGGIEAEAAMLGQPVSMLIPRVVGIKLHGELSSGTTATDLVLTITQLLREVGVVGSFVEFFGPGVSAVPLANRATIGNMSPEFGSTCAIFPIDAETLRYLRFTGRSAEQVALVEAYSKEQGLWHEPSAEAEAEKIQYSRVLELDLADVQPSIAGPKRPQDRVPLVEAKAAFRASVRDYVQSTQAQSAQAVSVTTTPAQSRIDEGIAESFPASDPLAVAPNGGEAAATPPDPLAALPEPPHSPVAVSLADGRSFTLDHGAVVIAAITSCTNTSNPEVMIGAALLAKRAVELGLATKPWVKTTLAPGSRVVTDYFEQAGLTPYLDKLGFHLVGYGCTTCIGNSGPLPPEISRAIAEHDLAAVAVLSGNRNFEGRINPDVSMNYLASPPLVVAYALAGSMDIDLQHEPLGTDSDGSPVYLSDIWPSPDEIAHVIADSVSPQMYTDGYADVFTGDDRWRALSTPDGDTFDWDSGSTYVRKPPYFDQLPAQPTPVSDVTGARVLAKLGNSVTTDHISPAGSIKEDSPAGRYLTAHGVERADFNSYGSRRGNHEVMIRGTFGNIRLRNLLAGPDGAPLSQGGFTRNWLTGKESTIYDASVAYAKAITPLLILAGKEYGSGSSRDWAAKGTALLGVKAVLAESFERIHRSNLIGMGVLPLQFPDGESADSLGLTGEETFRITGVTELGSGVTPETVHVVAEHLATENSSGPTTEFDAVLRIDTPGEAQYYRHGGILPYVLRSLRGESS